MSDQGIERKSTGDERRGNGGRISEMKAEGKLETGTPQVTDVGKGTKQLCTLNDFV